MKRFSITPRLGVSEHMKELGVHWHNDEHFWCETRAYEFEEEEIDTIEAAANELHQMYIQTTGELLTNNPLWLKALDIPEAMHNWVQAQFFRDYEKKNGIWVKKQSVLHSFLGRFDLAYDGNELKLLEYNADTPTAIIEASVAQWQWLQNHDSQADQFNSLHETLIDYFQRLKFEYPKIKCLHFTTLLDNVEDNNNLLYLQEAAQLGGFEAKFVALEDIGLDTTDNMFVDQDNEPIEWIFKLYPWEWMLREDFAKALSTSKTIWVEPGYKSIWSNKMFLVALWNQYPDHPLLLKASADVEDFLKEDIPYVAKPILGREGANVLIFEQSGAKQSEERDGPYGQNIYMFQQLAKLFTFEDISPQTNDYDLSVPRVPARDSMKRRHAILGVWVIDEQACCMGVREDDGLITTNCGQFICHMFNPSKNNFGQKKVHATITQE